MAVSTREWVDFFQKAGIPSEESASYALIFSRNRIQKNMLVDLNKEYLKDMGIMLLGDIIAILKHAQIVHESNSRASVLTDTTDTVTAVQVIEKIDLTKEKPKPEKQPSASGSSTTVKRLLDHYTRKFKEAEECLSAIPVKEPPRESNSDIYQVSEVAIEKKKHVREKTESHNSQRVHKTLSITPLSDSVAPSRRNNPIGGKAFEKKTVFDRLGDGTVSSTTPESKPKELSHNVAKSNSIFLRLGEVSSTSLVGEKLELKRDALPYAGVFKHVCGAGSVMEPSMRADAECELSSSSSSSYHTQTLIKGRLGGKDGAAALKRKNNLPKEARTDFLKARELKMLKITTEFADEDDAEMEVARRKLPQRKRAAVGDLEDVSLSKSPPKKVRFGGATHMIIPSAKSEYKKKPSELLKNFTNLKIIAESDFQREGIKARIGAKPSPAPTHSKMVSDTMVGLSIKSKMVSDTMVRKSAARKEPVKARIDLKPKKSVLDRLG